MDDPEGQGVVDQLRQLAWAVPISRDHMLKVVEEMPAFVRERAQQTADHLTFVCTRLQGLLAKLPEDVVLPKEVTEDLDGLRLSVEGSLRELDLLLEDLLAMLADPDEARRKLYN